VVAVLPPVDRNTPELVPLVESTMFQPAGRDDVTVLLARAFDRAWNDYYVPGRRSPISEEIARPSLGRHLVAMAKQGVKEEGALATGGLLHLISLTSDIREEAWRPPAFEVVSEPAAFPNERDQPRPLLGVASRFATAIGISAIVAFVFLVLIPRAQSDATEFASEHQTLPSAGAAEVTPEESQALLGKFMQWRQRR
jgi:hypothetical protein